MHSTLETLEAEVLQLSASDRSHLLERLILSLDTDPAVEQAWELEAARRDTELESGAVQAGPGDAMMARLRARLGAAAGAVLNAESLALRVLASAESDVKVPAAGISHRQPSPLLAGTRIIGDIMPPVVDAADWDASR